MQMTQTKSREKVLAVATAVVLGSVFVVNTIIEPQLSRRRELSLYKSQLQLDLTHAQGNLLMKDRTDRQFTQIRHLFSDMDTIQQEISHFARQLDDIYSKLSLEIRSVRLLPVTERNHYSQLAVRIEMISRMTEFIKFIQDIEGHDAPISIEQLDITAQETADTVMASMIITKIISMEHYDQ